MGIFSDLFGTTKAYFKIGLSGVRLKNSSGDLIVRNTGDSADAAITASKVSVSGEILEINSDAAGSGADWLYRLLRPTSGMTAAVDITLPVDNGTPGQVLATDGDGVTSWISAASTAAADKIDTTNLAFGTASPVSMFSTGAADIINLIEIIIDTAFDGTPSLSIGVAGTTSKYAGTTDIDLTQADGTKIVLHPTVAAAGIEALIATYSAGGASVGAARILTHYATPS